MNGSGHLSYSEEPKRCARSDIFQKMGSGPDRPPVDVVVTRSAKPGRSHSFPLVVEGDEPGMSRRLGIECRRAREQAGLTLMDIANRAGVAQSVIANFENQPGWRRRTDAIVAAYETELHLEPGTLWRRAVGS
jgi:ribosome-binding protein aMBF1 (putative translation factor)